MKKSECIIELPEPLNQPFRVLHPHFLSYTIDISVLLGGIGGVNQRNLWPG